MDALIHRLQTKLREHPDNVDLTEALDLLNALKEGGKPTEEHLGLLQKKVTTLRQGGLWEPTKDEAAALEDLRAVLAASQSETTNHANKSTGHNQSASNSEPQSTPSSNASHSANSHQAVPRLPSSFATPTALPIELYTLLNQAYQLHVLAVEPETILPPGKSLLSMMARPHAQQHPVSALQGRVENMVHKAFWDEALEALSNPSPPVQLARLKRLYEDLHTSLSSLLPPNNVILVTLSSPLSPTSSPLRSAVVHLRELLHALKQRCAPARDPQIDALLRALDDPPDSVLAKTIVEVVRSILKLADEMKDDLSQFVVGSMSEQQLKDMIVQQAMTRERDLVRQLWRPEIIRDSWNRWIAEIEHPTEEETVSPKEILRRKFIRRLMHALGTNHGVSCELPTVTVDVSPAGTLTRVESAASEAPPPSSNALPPPLLFITPSLFSVQNYLQALVITASLRALVRIPTTPAKRKIDADEDEELSEYGFVRRIWTLLRSDIDGTHGELEEGDLKIVNLADEVVRISKAYGVENAMEPRLREAVDRTLRVTDPVFMLLQKRLVQAIATHLVQHTPVPNQDKAAIRAGRSPGRQAKRVNLVIESEDGDIVHVDLDFARETLNVKGFDHGVLVNAISEVVAKLRQCIAWTEAVWPDLFERS